MFLSFFNFFDFGANKENLLHVTHCFITSLSFSQISFLSKLFQHFKPWTYEHVMSFLCLVMHFFFYFIMICSHLKCYTPNNVHLIMCASCEKKQLKQLMNRKKEYYFLNVFPMFLLF